MATPSGQSVLARAELAGKPLPAQDVKLTRPVFAPIFAGLAALFAGIFNLIAAGLEMLIALVVPAFKIKRIQRRKRSAGVAASDAAGNGEDEALPPGGEPVEDKQRAPLSRSAFLVRAALAGVIILAAALWPIITERSITLVAKDGHSLPYAAVIFHTGSGDKHLRSDKAGNLKAPRFGLRGITIKDPRYVEQTWRGEDITPQLVVSRTVLGSSLDVWAAKLMKPAEE